MTHIQQRRDNSATWTSVNPVLLLGEVGWETDTNKAKLGDGVTAWSALPYAIESAPVTSVAGKTGAVALVKADVGLSNVDNTSDANKPVSTAQQAALNLKAPLASPAFTGNPTAPTPATSDNDTSIATTAFVKASLAAVLSAIYPVGSLYFTTVNTNPGAQLGGTWAAWGSGRVPVGVDAAQAEFNTVEKTGGEKTHVLTTPEMPSHSHSGTALSNGSHSHTFNAKFNNNADLFVGTGAVNADGSLRTTDAAGAHTHTLSINNTGGGGAHNNLQPYITCYMWKRTA